LVRLGILSSLTSTCHLHDIDPQLYFTQLLANLSAIPASELASWLPVQRKLRNAEALNALKSAAPEEK
jgi:hypothetical protein